MSIYSYQIHELHLEPTSDCNARCPLCPRTYHQTLETHPLLNLNSWTETELENVLADRLFRSLQSVLVNGNFGDIVMHSNPESFLRPLLKRNLKITINTNGGALSRSFWKWLGSHSQIHVNFAIDGLEDTHALYRRNTRFETVLKNANTFIDAGGEATWIMTLFNNNRHQVDKCNSLAKKYKFSKFETRPSARHNGKLSVLDKKFDHAYYLEDGNSKKQLGMSQEQCQQGLDNYFAVFPPLELSNSPKSKIKCKVSRQSSIFLSYDKRLWPCCWTALSFELEKTKQQSLDVMQLYKEQLEKDFYFNDVLKHSPSTVLKKLQGFENFRKSWKSKSPCITCQNECGV